MTKSPAFQFYPADWLGSQRIALMPLEEEGAYIRLLCYCWQHGSIPADCEKVARLVGKGASTTLIANVVSMFQPHPDDPTTLLHDRLEQERAKQAAWREKSSEGGRKSAAKRWGNGDCKGGGKGGYKMVVTKPQPKCNSSSSSSSSSSSDTPYKSPKGDDVTNPLFLRFWHQYPKKKAKQAAMRAFRKIHPDDTLLDTILTALERQKASADWQRDNGQYIPHASTWLNGRRWEDEVTPSPRETTAEQIRRLQATGDIHDDA